MDKLLIFTLILAAWISIASALECYTCTEQDSNRDKCITTTKQCEQFQDACTSHIRWGVPPYWTPRGDRIYYISKGCDTRQGCSRREAATTSHCKRDWYNDWACVECCTGDLCNYYVTLLEWMRPGATSGAGAQILPLGAGSTKASLFTVVAVALGLTFMRRLL